MITILLNKKKGTILEGLLKGEKQVPIEILKKSKDASHNATQFTRFFSLLSNSFQGVSILFRYLQSLKKIL